MTDRPTLPQPSAACVDDMLTNGACLQGLSCPCDCHRVREFDCTDPRHGATPTAADIERRAAADSVMWTAAHSAVLDAAVQRAALHITHPTSGRR